MKKLLLSMAMIAMFAGVASAATVDLTTVGKYDGEVFIYVSDVSKGDNIVCNVYENGYVAGTVSRKAVADKIRISTLIDHIAGDITASCSSITPYGVSSIR